MTFKIIEIGFNGFTTETGWHTLDEFYAMVVTS